MVRFLKKIWSIFSFLFILIIVLGCDYKSKRNISNDDFEIHITDEENKKVAIGNIKYQPADGSVFIPYSIDGYTVSVLGIPSMSFKADLDNYYVDRIYLPSTIEKIGHPYISEYGYMEKVFICNEPINITKLSVLYSHNMGYAPVIVYVPSEYYKEYAAIHEPYFIDIYKANVCYYFNIDENDYYYVDYYEEGSLIEFIPPIPIREGYIFEGWYTETECINKWDFEIDLVELAENIDEIKLFAKWINE